MTAAASKSGKTSRTKPVDAAVREEIRTKLGVNMCVEAGAGTGKTTSLVNRIVELVASGRADADHVGVITFTEKAAAELSSRVRERLEQAIAAEKDPTRRDQLTTAVRALYRSRIETIHAFAANVLRERPVEAGLDPEYSILSGLEADLLFDEQYGIWLDELMSATHLEVERALNVGLSLDDFRAAAETVHRFRYLLPLKPFPPVKVDPARLVAWLDKHVPELIAIRDRCLEEESDALPEIEKLVGLRERLEVEGTTDAARDRVLAYRLPAPKQKGSQGQWEDPEDCRNMKALFKEFLKFAHEVPDALRTNALLGVLPHIESFVATYAEHRRKEGLADFDDILIWARDVLRNDLAIRSYFQQRFAALLIDEFQDTDPIQVEIATYLTAEGQKGANWRKLVPSEGKLFVVGDPKQSIYRFRRADIAIYDEVKRYQLAHGYREITQNFRSSAPLLEWINGVFDEVLEEVEGVQPPNVDLKPWHEGVAMKRPPVVVVRKHDKELNADGVRKAEAEAVAAVLRDATGHGESTAWEVREQAGGDAEVIRAATPGDIAILLPTRTGLEAYEDALARAGLPFRHEGSRDYFQRDEVRELVLLLQSVDDPLDKVALVGALRSSAFGCSDDDIVIHLGTGGSWDYRSEKESESERVMAAMSRLRKLHWRRSKLSLPELVQEVIHRSRLIEFALTLPDGAQSAANLLGIVEQARAFTTAGGGGPRAFTRWLVQHAERQAAEVDTDIAEEGDDVVRLLTMHGSKGLEFPIVVLANLATGGRSDREPVPDEEANQLHFRVGVGNRTGFFATPDYEERWDHEKGAQDAEQIRLLYVAATRARDHLIVPDISGKKPGLLLSSLQPLLPEADGHEIGADDVWLLDADELELPPTEPPKAKRASRPEVTAAERERGVWFTNHKETVADARKELKLTIASSVERSVRPLAAEASHSAAAMLVSEGPPLEVGDALHLVMERVSLPQAEDLDDVATAICLEAGIAEHTEEVTELALRCLDSPSVKRALEVGTYQREVPFTVSTDEGFALGRVDFTFRDEEGLHVVDFKTDEVSKARAKAHTLEQHSEQAFTYQQALSAATRLPVNRVTFVYCRPSTEVKLKVEPADEITLA